MYQKGREKYAARYVVVDSCTRDDFREIGHCGDYRGIVVSAKCGKCWDCHPELKINPEQFRTHEIPAAEVKPEDYIVFSDDDGSVQRVKVIDQIPGLEEGSTWFRFQCHGGPVAAADVNGTMTVLGMS